MKKFFTIAISIFTILQLTIPNVFANETLKYVQKAYNAQQNGHYLFAIRNYNKALKITPNDIDIEFLKLSCYLKQNDYEKIIIESTNILNKKEDANIYITRANAKWRNNDFDGALYDCNKAISLNNKNNVKNDYAYYVKGRANGVKGDYISAINDFTMSIKIEPNNPDAFLYRGIAKATEATTKKTKNEIITGLKQGLEDINYAKEQYLKMGNLNGYNKTLEYYTFTLNTINEVKKL